MPMATRPAQQRLIVAVPAPMYAQHSAESGQTRRPRPVSPVILHQQVAARLFIDDTSNNDPRRICVRAVYSGAPVPRRAFSSPDPHRKSLRILVEHLQIRMGGPHPGKIFFCISLVALGVREPEKASSEWILTVHKRATSTRCSIGYARDPILAPSIGRLRRVGGIFPAVPRAVSSAHMPTAVRSIRPMLPASAVHVGEHSPAARCSSFNSLTLSYRRSRYNQETSISATLTLARSSRGQDESHHQTLR